MSKAEKTAKAIVPSPLRKDLVQALKVLQTVTTSLDKLEASFIECDAAVINEKMLKNEVSALQKEIDNLRERHDAVLRKQEQDTAAFADIGLKLTGEYNSRLAQTKRDSAATTRDVQAQMDLLDKKWEQRLETEKLETRRAQEDGGGLRRELEDQIQKAKHAQQKSEDSYTKLLRQDENRIAELARMNQSLKKELSEHETMLKGRDTEIQRLRGRLASLEAFRPHDSADEVATAVSQLHEKVRDFCVKCVDASDPLPGWNQFPEAVRFSHLPGIYRSDSEAGRYVLIAALQHSVSSMMKESIFIPFVPCASQETQEVAEALRRRSRSHEALWRLITFNTVATDQELAKASKAKLQRVSISLFESWKLLLGEDERKTLESRVTALFFDCATIWCDLMRIRDHIYVDDNVRSQCFDSDSEEEHYNVPSGFKIPDSTSPVLCLFPAFFGTMKSDSTSQPIIIRKGTAMFRDSAPLLVALSEEQEVSSPRAAYKKTAR